MKARCLDEACQQIKTSPRNSNLSGGDLSKARNITRNVEEQALAEILESDKKTIITSQDGLSPLFLITVLDIYYVVSMSGRSKSANRERLVLRGYHGMEIKI